MKLLVCNFEISPLEPIINERKHFHVDLVRANTWQNSCAVNCTLKSKTCTSSHGFLAKDLAVGIRHFLTQNFPIVFDNDHHLSRPDRNTWAYWIFIRLSVRQS